MNLKKTTTGIIIGATAIVGTTFGIDSKINPYENFPDRVEMITASDLPNSGEQKVEVKKDRPEVRFKKWNGEVDLGITYNDVKATGNRPLLSNKMEFKNAKQEVAVYPLNSTSTEIEIILNEKPATNVVSFTLDNYQNLDFFYQPALTQKEIDEGAFRPENVVGSYAVYANGKKNYCTNCGTPNYGTGKIGHFYRPLITDSAGTSVWGDLHIENGILSVTIPQSFLDTAVYAVIVDPTFGYTSIGANAMTNANVFEAFEVGTIGAVNSVLSKLQAAVYDAGGNSHIGLALYDATPTNLIANSYSGSLTVTRTTKPTQDSEWTFSTSVSASLTANTNYWTAGNSEDTSVYWSVDYSGGASKYGSNAYANFPNATKPATNNSSFRFSVYATYTASEGTATPNNDILLFE